MNFKKVSKNKQVIKVIAIHLSLKLIKNPLLDIVLCTFMHS